MVSLSLSRLFVSHRTLLVLLCTACLIEIACGSEIRRPKRRWCGRKLTKMVATVCKHCYRQFNDELAKRSVLGYIRDALEDSQAYFDSMKERLLPTGVSPAKRGIVEECCHKNCSYSQLLEYCCDETWTGTATVNPAWERFWPNDVFEGLRLWNQDFKILPSQRNGTMDKQHSTSEIGRPGWWKNWGSSRG